MVWAHFFEKHLEVVHRRSCLYGVLHIGATCVLVDAIAVVDSGLLVALFSPFLAGLGIFLGTLDNGSG
jgi:hypothetical protein